MCIISKECIMDVFIVDMTIIESVINVTKVEENIIFEQVFEQYSWQVNAV